MSGTPSQSQGQINPGSENRMHVEPNYANQPQMPTFTPRGTQQSTDTLCAFCNQMTKSYHNKGAGNNTWLWCCLLFLFTGICCWIPFVCDACLEDQVMCHQCHRKKAVI